MAYSAGTASRGPREDLAQTLRQIYDLDLTTTSGGNLSLCDDDGRIWITPAGMDKAELRPDQIVCVEGRDPHSKTDSIDTKSTGLPRPSSELPFHQALYAERPDLRAIIHAHPISLVAFSIAGQVPDTRVSAHCHVLCGTIGFAPYALPASSELGEKIAKPFSKGFDCVVLENHGVVVGGATLREAFERLEALDLCARTIHRARIVGKERPLTKRELELASPRSVAPSLPESPLMTEQEDALRQKLCAIARRAYTKRLMTSTQGTLSARLSKDTFLLTPASGPLDRLEPSNLLRVGLESRFRSRHDSREALHAALYRAHPDVGAVAHGCAANAAGFSAAGIPLPSRTIPESYILIREPVYVSFEATRLDPESIASVLCPDNPIALVHKEGALSLGAHVLDAFDRLEVLEATAAALITSRSLGELTPISDERLAELRRTFFPIGGFQGAIREGS